MFEAIFAGLQLFPNFRDKEIIQKGVGYWYVGTCVFQIWWTLAFAYEMIWLSLLLMLLLWASLLGLVYSQYYTNGEGTYKEFWLLRFPFALHCGWLTVATALNVNIAVVVGLEAEADVQLAIAVVSVAYLYALSIWILFGIARPNYTIAGVLTWSFGWMHSELSTPQVSIVDRFDPDVISGMSYVGLAIAELILIQMVVRGSLSLLALPKYQYYPQEGTTRHQGDQPLELELAKTGSSSSADTEPEAMFDLPDYQV